MSDDFLRLLLLRYCFCTLVLHSHRGFRGPAFYPAALPPLPESELMECRRLHKLLQELELLLDCKAYFPAAGLFLILK
ncbi:unnamed protein product [Protopolystoma xenopodis]|uniref:Secreted protein n=1 Tax=Protopolystoma xenopodis TaxID=117903 RepID=A0A448WKC7_9PLAT|nr:unnamed protein product [Protopolystoma xenopodis]